MNEENTSHGSYVEKVRDDTREYILEILEDNARLRRAQEALERELREDREENERLRRERRDLRRELSQAETEQHRFSARYVEVEEQNNNLANLYVASYRLHEGVSRQTTLTAVQEIIVNLVGCEEFAIFEKRPGSSEISLAVSQGVGPGIAADFSKASGPIARTFETGELLLAEEYGQDAPVGGSEPLVCIPLRLGDEVYGVIVLMRLLSHKDGLQPLDFELFDLIACQAALPLCFSSLTQQAGLEDCA